MSELVDQNVVNLDLACRQIRTTLRLCRNTMRYADHLQVRNSDRRSPYFGQRRTLSHVLPLAQNIDDY